MSAAAVIDSLEFARSEQQLRGSLAIDSLRRLDDVLFDSQGSVDFELRGTKDGRNRPQIELRVLGPLHLQCQRCLQFFSYELDVANTMLVVPSGSEIDPELVDDPEAPDVIEGAGDQDVAALIEEEILLSLPLAPRHPPGMCRSAFEHDDDAPAAMPSAFAQLAALKRPQSTNRRKS